MLRLELSPQARDDLRDIAQYTYARYGEQQMDKYLQSLQDAMRLLGENPHIGHSRDDIPAGCHVMNAERHLLVFTVKHDSLMIIRILHQSRDPKRFFQS